MYNNRMPRKPASDAERAFGSALGIALSERRNVLGLSGGDLARASGVSLDAIRSIETGRVSNPGLYSMVQITMALGLTLDEFTKSFTKDTAKPGGKE